MDTEELVAEILNVTAVEDTMNVVGSSGERM